MTEIWPDPAAPYDYPSRTPANELRWQAAITAAVTAGSLELTARSGNDDHFELTGTCPRCSHMISQSIEFEVILGAFPTPVRSGDFNISCNCRKAHSGRDDNHVGCGWGGSIPVTLTVK